MVRCSRTKCGSWLRTSSIILEEIPGAADNMDIDHLSGLDSSATSANIMDMERTGATATRSITVHLGTVELERSCIFHARFSGWISHIECLDADTHEDVLNTAADRVVETAKWAQARAKERKRSRSTSVFGEGIAA